MRPFRFAAIAAIALLAATLAPGAWATATVNKQFTPATVDPGDISRLRISFFNSSLVPLTAAALTDNLPALVAIAAIPNIADTCAFGTVVAAAGTQSIRLSGGTIPAGTGIGDGTCFVELDVISTTPGNYPNTIPANGPSNGFTPGGAVAGFQGIEIATVVTNTTAAVATLSVRALLSPTGTKTFTPVAGLANEPVALTIVLANPNASSTIPLTTVIDTFPLGLVVAPTPAATIACTGTGAANGAVTANAGAGSVTLTGGAIGNSGTCTLKVNVVAPTITGTTQTFVNTLPANAIGNTRNLASASFTRSLVVTSPITLAKSFVATIASGVAIGATPVVAGQEVFVRLDISNASTINPLSITSFTDSLPAGLVVGVAAPSIDCTSNGGGTNGTIAATPGASSFTVSTAVVGIVGATKRCRIHVPVVASAAGAYLNSIPANAVTNPGSLGSPAASATLNVNSQFTVAKTVSPSTAAPGQPVTFTIAISNFSTGAVGGVAFTDTLPAPGGQQMVISSPSNFTASAGCIGGTFSNTPGASVLSWSGGTVVGGAGINPGVCTISFRANAPITATIGTTFTNAIPANAITGIGGITNPNGSSVNVVMVAAASLAKSFAPAGVVQGGTSVLTVTLSNQTAVSLTNAAVTDNLPAGVMVSAIPGTATTCAGGVVTAAALGSTGSIAGATIPGNGSCNFRFNVVGIVVGTRTNTIPALALTNDQGSSNPAAATANLTVTSGLTAAKFFTPASVANGGISRVTVRVSNPSVTSFTNLQVVDGPMVSTLAVANPANASTTCAGAPVITAVPGSNTVTLSGAALAAGGNCDLLFDVITSGNPTNWPNNLPIGAITTAEGSSNTAQVSATLNKVTGVSIGINKSFNPVSVSGSAPSVLQIDLTNPVGSPSAVNNLSFTDNLPAGMEVHATPNISTTCTNGTVTAVRGTATVSLSGGTLAAASTCSVFVNVTSVRFLNLTNTIPVGAVTTTQALTNSLATTATLSTLQGLGVMKSFTPTSAAVGQPVLLDIRLLSTLNPLAIPPVTLNNVSFTDTLPAGITVATPGNATTNCVNGVVTAGAGSSTVTVSGADIDPGTDCHILVDVVADSLGAFTNTIAALAVTSSEGYSNPNPAMATLNVVNPLTLAKSFSPGTVLPGQVAVLTITLNNPNALALTNVALTDTLPAGLVTSTTPNAVTTCVGGAVAAAASASTIALTNGTMAANSACTITVNVLSNIPNTYVNTLAGGAIGTAEGVSNVAPASGTLIVLGPPGIAKTFTPSTIAAGSTSDLTITLSNSNAAAAMLTSALVDAMPAGVTTAGPQTGTCAGVSVAPNAITMAAGSSIPSGGCTIVVAVTSTTPGTVTNVTGTLATNAGTTQPATANLTVIAPPTLGKAFAPGTIAIGGVSTLTLTLGNINPTPVTLTSALVDAMPTGVTITGPDSGSCAGVTVAATSITMASGTVVPPGGCAIVVPVSSTTPGTATNVTGTLATTAGTALPAQAPLIVTAIAPTLSKSITPATIAMGGTASLVLTLGNGNAVDITLSAVFTDTMPSGVTITGPSTGTCAAVTVSATSLGMAAGATVPVGGCTIIVSITSLTPGTVTNTTGTLDTNAGSAPPATAPLTVNEPPTLVKSIAPAMIGIGGSSTLTLTLGNGNAQPIALVAAFVDPMPPGVTTIGVAGGTCTGVTLSPTAVTVASGTAIPSGGCTIVVAITSGTPGTVTNITGALDTSAGSAPPASAPLTVTVVIPVLAKSMVPAVIASGGASTLTITLSNSNAATLTLAAAFTDAMPAGVTTTSANTGTCSGVVVSTTLVTMPAGGTIPPGGCTIVVGITSTTPGAVINVTSALQTQAGSTPAASAPLTVTAVSGSLTKSILPASIAAGGAATLTLGLGNPNATPLTLATAFNDPMPAGLTTTSANTGTCAGVTVGTSLIAMAAGSTIPPGGCTIVVALTSSTPGTVTNTTGALQTEGGTTPPASAPLTVTAVTPTLTKTILPATIVSGGSSTLTLTLANANAAQLTLTAPFTDAMPAGMTITGGNSGTCTGVTVAPTLITIASGSSLPPGGCTIVVSITSTTPGTVTNTTSALTTGAGVTPPASAPLVVTAAGPSLAKSFTPSTIVAGSTATLVIVLGNTNASVLTLTAPFTDAMPPGVTILGTNTGTCAGVTITSTLITMAAGSTIAPGGCNIIVDVVSVTAGAVTNVTGPLSTNGGVAPSASTPLAVLPSGPPMPIPVGTPLALGILVLLLLAGAGWQTVADRRWRRR